MVTCFCLVFHQLDIYFLIGKVQIDKCYGIIEISILFRRGKIWKTPVVRPYYYNFYY